MREPPLGLDEVPHPGLAVFFDEILAAPTTAELLVGPLRHALSGPRRGPGELRRPTPTRCAMPPRCASAGSPGWRSATCSPTARQAVACLVDEEAPGDAALGRMLGDCLRSAGGLDGAASGPTAAGPAALGEAVSSTTRCRAATSGSRTCGTRASTPRRSSTTRRSTPRPKTLMMLFKRLREIDVPEMMASIIHQTKGKPWEYYRDMSRQLWDEARHAMMGEVGFVALGVDWTKARITHNWSHAAEHRVHADGAARRAVLHRAGADDARPASGSSGRSAPRRATRWSATIQDFDWADEVLHAQIGRRVVRPAVRRPRRRPWTTATGAGRAS